MQLPSIPKFSIGSPVELKTLWKRATVYKSTWNKEANQYVYFLVGDDINPLAPYKESILVAGVPQTPNYQAQYEGVKYRIYIDFNEINYCYWLWEDGKFIHSSAYNFVQKADARNAAMKRLSKVLIAQEAS
jgi:hypothetical protein